MSQTASNPVQELLVAPRLAALGNETRLAIYRSLVRAGQNGLPVAGVQERLQIPASTLSHHLRRLVEVGLVTQEREGTTLHCTADFQVMSDTFALFQRECCADVSDPTQNPCC